MMIMNNSKIFFNAILIGFTALIYMLSTSFKQDYIQEKIDGKFVYTKNCSVCHRNNGKGIPHTFPPLYKSDYLKNHSKEEIISIILKGQKGKLKVNGKIYNNVMTPFKNLSNEEIAAVLTYISNNFGNSSAVYLPDEVKKVRESLGK